MDDAAREGGRPDDFNDSRDSNDSVGSDDSGGFDDSDHTATPRTSLLLLSLWLVPWSVLVVEGRPATLVFPWGLFDPSVGRLVSLYSYLFEFTGGFGSLPAYLRAWPTSVVAFLLATASAAGGVFVDREDPRVTVILLVLAGLGQLSLAWGFAQQPGRIAIPVGTLALWAVAWVRYQ